MFLPAPPGLRADEIWSATPWVFTILGAGMGFALLPYCLIALRRRDTTPLLFWIGGFASGFVAEPLLDVLGHLWWPSGYPGPSFTLFYVTVPALIPPTYAAYTGMIPYLGYRLLLHGLTKRQIMLLFGIFVGSDVFIQGIGTALKAYVYYGDQPLRIGAFPVLTSLKNGAAYLLIGFLAWSVLPALRGWAKSAFLIALPLTGYLAGALAVAWPRYLTLSSSISTLWTWALAALSIALAVLLTRGIAALAATDSEWRMQVTRRTSLLGAEP